MRWKTAQPAMDSQPMTSITLECVPKSIKIIVRINQPIIISRILSIFVSGARGILASSTRQQSPVSRSEYGTNQT